MTLAEHSLSKEELRLTAIELARYGQQCPNNQEDLPDDLYDAYLDAFSRLGIYLEESRRLKNMNAFLIVSPMGATVVVRKTASRREKVFHCAHGLGHIVLNHGRGKRWFILNDYPDDPPEERDLNREAGVIAEAFLTGRDVERCMRATAFRWALRYGMTKRFIRDVLLPRLRELGHTAGGKLPVIKEILKNLPYAPELVLSSRAVMNEAARDGLKKELEAVCAAAIRDLGVVQEGNRTEP